MKKIDKNFNLLSEYIRSKGLSFPLSKDDLLNFIYDRETYRIISKHFPIGLRNKLISTADMGKVERFIYSSYFNHYTKLKKNTAENKPTKKLLSRYIKNNVKLYFKNYKFIYRFPVGFNKLMKRLKNKAYYDVFGKRL